MAGMPSPHPGLIPGVLQGRQGASHMSHTIDFLMLHLLLLYLRVADVVCEVFANNATWLSTKRENDKEDCVARKLAQGFSNSIVRVRSINRNELVEFSLSSQVHRSLRRAGEII